MKKAFFITFLLSLTAKVGAVAIIAYAGNAVAAGTVAGILVAGDVLLVVVRRKKRALCEKLASAFPVVARVKEPQGGNEMQPPRVEKGSTVVVQNGERIPVDGMLMSETARLNEFPLAGESKEVVKKAGALAYAGSLNEGDQIMVEAVAAGGDTLIAQRYHAVRFADVIRSRAVRVAYGTGIICVLAAAIIAFVLYFSARHNSMELAAALLLVVSGAEAAYFVAVLTSLVFARIGAKGIVLKNPAQFDRLAGVSLCVLHQTPLTRYRETTIASIRTFWGASTEDVLALVAAAGLYLDSDALAAAVRAAQEKNIAHHLLEKLTVTKDQGSVAVVGGLAVVVGTAEFVGTHNVHIQEEVKNYAASEVKRGYAACVVARDHKIIGVVSFADGALTSMQGAVAQFKDMGVRTVVFADSHSRGEAERIAQGLGAEVCFAELSGLAVQMRACVKPGERALFLGDGVHDAALLSEAAVGIVMRADDKRAAFAAGETVFLGNDFGRIPQGIMLARRAAKLARNGTLLAIATNICGIALVITGVLGAIGAAAWSAAVVVVAFWNAILIMQREEYVTV